MKYGAFLLSFGTILSYVLGVLRDMLFSRFYGASGLTDAYFSAFLVSDIALMIFVASALLGSLTPIFIREKSKNYEHGLHMFGIFFTYIPGFFLIISALGIYFAESIFPFFFPHLYAQYPVEFIFLGKLFFLSNAFFAFSNVLGNFLMSEKHFLSTALSPLFYNIGIIGGISFGAAEYGIIAAGVGGVVGAAMHLLLRVLEYFLQKTRFPFPVFSPQPALFELIKTMMFRWTTVALFPLMLVGMSRFAGTYSEGLYSLFLYSRNIISAPVAIFGVAFATAAFSHLSSLYESNKHNDFVQYFFQTIQKVLFWTIPTAIGVFFIGTEFLAYLYHLGNTPEEKFLLTSLVMILSLAIPFESINNVLSRTLNALHMGKTLVSSNILFLLVVFFVTITIAHFWHLPSVAMAMGYTTGFILQVIYIFFFLFRNPLFTQNTLESNLIHSIFIKSLWANIAMASFLFLHEGYSVLHEWWFVYWFLAVVMFSIGLYVLVLSKSTQYSVIRLIKTMV